ARILSKRFVGAPGERHNPIESVLFHVRDMLHKPPMTIDAVLGAADRPPQKQAQRRTGTRGPERNRGGTPHASAHDVRSRDAKMIEQPVRLPDVVSPRDAFDAAAGLAGFTTVEHDALVLL